MKIFNFLGIILLSVFSVQSQTSEKIVAWNEVEITPKFSGCEDSTSPDDCSNRSFIDFVKSEFDNTIISELKSDYIINFKIIIGTDGKLRWSSVKSNNETIKKEAERILALLPAYSPGSLSNKLVNVVTSYRIKLERQQEISNLEEVDIPPIPRNCEKEDNKKVCLSASISRYVNSNFSIDIVRSDKTGQSIFRTTVNFVINKKGQIANVTAIGDNDLMNGEAMRVVKTIPAMQPAISNGKPVAVNYSLPITIGISR